MTWGRKETARLMEKVMGARWCGVGVELGKDKFIDKVPVGSTVARWWQGQEIRCRALQSPEPFAQLSHHQANPNASARARSTAIHHFAGAAIACRDLPGTKVIPTMARPCLACVWHTPFLVCMTIQHKQEFPPIRWRSDGDQSLWVVCPFS